MRVPDFSNLLSVLNRRVPSRPVIFELFLNERLYTRFGGREASPDPVENGRRMMKAYETLGYDYMTLYASAFTFPRAEVDHLSSLSLNAYHEITDRASFNAYPWPDPDAFDQSRLDALGAELPGKMRLIVFGPGGVLENVEMLVGFDRMCYIIADDPGLAGDIFDAVGSRLVRYYERCAHHPAVGALISNDDWGFKTQTMLSPRDMRRFVFPWHKRIVETIHAAGKPAVLHSCGNLAEVMDDVIDDMKYDAKHSFEDTIEPIEKAYDRYGSRIALLGGIDVDFLCRSSAADVRRRARAMLERSASRGGWALGTGNSVPEYIPESNFLSMLSVATGLDFA
jgi:uroporphyrinogen decarboxylase